jgi:hypothetical protein
MAMMAVVREVALAYRHVDRALKPQGGRSK